MKKNQMKFKVIMLGVSIVAVSVLSGCGSTTSSSSDNTVPMTSSQKEALKNVSGQSSRSPR